MCVWHLLHRACLSTTMNSTSSERRKPAFFLTGSAESRRGVFFFFEKNTQHHQYYYSSIVDAEFSIWVFPVQHQQCRCLHPVVLPLPLPRTYLHHPKENGKHPWTAFLVWRALSWKSTRLATDPWGKVVSVKLTKQPIVPGSATICCLSFPFMQRTTLTFDTFFRSS